VIDRRMFVGTVALGALAMPRVTLAQQAGKIYRIGWLSPGPASGRDGLIDVFRRGMREHGWLEGQDFTIEYRGAERKPERYPDLAAQLVRARVEVIVTAGGPATLHAARDATRTIPIVMVAATIDPIGQKVIASLAKPGGNITGLAGAPELGGKRLELLKEAMPALLRIGILWDASTGSYRPSTETADVARSLRVQLVPLEVHGPDDLAGAFTAAVRKQIGAISIASTPLISQHRARIADLAVQHRMPTISYWRYFAEAGGLMTYGPSRDEQFHRAAYYVTKILKGAKPADLPVEQPTRFYLVINMKTAKALALTIPPSLLLRADQVIE
jgi:putative ABC transport system substrate-binding protein